MVFRQTHFRGFFRRSSKEIRPFIEHYGGLGLGLSIAHTLTKAHGGTLEAASEGLDKGAKFTARFKIDDSATETREDERPIAAKGTGVHWPRKPDYGTNYHTKWRPVRGATQTGRKEIIRQHHHRQIASPNKTISTLRTSVGEFVFRQTPLGCHLELVVGNGRWPLGLYGTNEAAVRALKNGRTGFRTWDALGRKTAANQIGTLSRWNKGEQTP